MPPRQPDPTYVLAVLLAGALVVALLVRLERTRALDELEEARRDRAHLENELEKKSQQVDGALAKISELKNGDPEP